MRKLPLIMVLCTATPSLAQSGYTVFGIGTLTCDGYAREVTESRQAAEAYSWWVSGFLTQANVAKNRVISTEAGAHDAWLKRYCGQNPRTTFVDAAAELDRELDKGKGL